MHGHFTHFNRKTLWAWCAAALYVLALQGCPVDTVNINEDLTCENEGETSGLRVCQGGVWVLVEGELDLGTLDMPGPVDMPGGCVAESDVELCTANQTVCGPLFATDRCGTARTIAECGTCGNAEICMGGSCEPECDGQTSAVLCNNEGAACGPLETTDSCGNPRQIDCGACEGRDVCDDTTNLCVCTPRTDLEVCQAEGAQCGVVSADDGCGTTVNVDCGGCDMAGDFLCNLDNQCVCPEESEAQFCGRNNAQCGMVEAKNNCDETITVDCGGCDNNDPCNANKTCPVCQPFTDDALCANAGLQCGTHMVTNNCGDTVEVTCGSCGNDTVCNAQGTCECPQPSCSGVECGLVSNACGNTRTCSNTCNTTTEQCSGNSCICKPESDAELCISEGATCGSISVTDRCGTPRTVVCGSCGGGQVCTDANVCCTPQSNSSLCNANGRECGSLTTMDNCGVQRTINNCGSCSAGETCRPNGTCQCPMPSCAGVDCGQVTNACGNTTNCPNNCSSTTQQCSGNMCVCKPETEAELCAAGNRCGTLDVTNRCGDTVTIMCGGCSGGESCMNNQCDCPVPSCSGVECGMVTNACGNTRTCSNTCNATTEQCSGNTCVCRPETDAALCTSKGIQCGVISSIMDRCGNTRNNVDCDAAVGCSGTQQCALTEASAGVCCSNTELQNACVNNDLCGSSTSVTVPSCGGGTVPSFDCSGNDCSSFSNDAVCQSGSPSMCCDPLQNDDLDLAAVCVDMRECLNGQSVSDGCGGTLVVDCLDYCQSDPPNGLGKMCNGSDKCI